ncbi:membrane protein [Corynebacterium atypicum]|uniref:Membrane protein n=1 Tax=Corynebacterium atypicum TaxID=191610 RepID=A0ABM5QNQ8_9CORY|nr:YggT family protein [Corynebacterium atypicum]AIG64422.1 membrane protein [Corynebacterium atypicum]
MNQVGILLLVLIQLFQLILVARIVIEVIRSFSRSFRPPSWFYVVAEPLFMITDPPVKALRKLIPPLRMGGVALDVSVIVLFVILALLSQLIRLALL